MITLIHKILTPLLCDCHYYYRHALRYWRVHTAEAAEAARAANRLLIVYKRCMLHWKWFAAAEVARKRHSVALLGTVLQRNRQWWSLEQAFTGET
jgi:hypothetical protein